MDIHMDMGQMDAAACYAQRVISIVDEMGHPDYMTIFHPAYLMIGDVDRANELCHRHLNKPLEAPIGTYLRDVAAQEREYNRFGYSDAFRQICERLEQEFGESLRKKGISQLSLKPLETGITRLADESQEFASVSWEWLDPEGASSYSICDDYIEIKPAASSSLGDGNSAPRLYKAVSGSFTIEAFISRKDGGIFIFGGKDIITLQRDVGDIHFRNSTDHVSRGMINSKSAIIRLERDGDTIHAYCSGDGEKWYSCGQTISEMDDPVQVGVFAASYWEPDVATRFEYIRLDRL